MTALGISRPVCGLAEHDEAPIGLEENREQAVQQLGQHLGQPQGHAQVLADLASGPSAWPSVFSSSRKPDEPAEMFSFDMIVEYCDACWSSSTMRASAVRSPRRAGWATSVASGGAEMKDEQQVADAHLVVFVEQLPLDDRPAVEERAVAAVQVFEIELAVDVEDPGVLPADGGRLQHDVAGGMPAKDDGGPFQGEQLSRIEPLQCSE